MSDWIQRLVAGGLLGAQLLLLAVVPTADARLEADALAPHAHEAHPSPSAHLGGTDAIPAWTRASRASTSSVHASHPSHDHRLCELCRALSVLGGPAPAPERAARVPERPLGSTAARADLPAVSTTFLPLGPRAPPFA